MKAWTIEPSSFSHGMLHLKSCTECGSEYRKVQLGNHKTIHKAKHVLTLLGNISLALFFFFFTKILYTGIRCFLCIYIHCLVILLKSSLY